MGMGGSPIWAAGCSAKCTQPSALLSQVRPVWTALSERAEQWSSQLSTSCTQLKEGVVATVKECAKKSHHPAIDAAFLLDPCNFTPEADESSLPRPPFEALSLGQQKAVNSLIACMSSGSVEAVEKEMRELDLGDKWPPPMAALAQQQAAAGAKEVPIVMRRNFWLRKASSHVPLTARAAARLLSMHATSAAAERNWSAWGRNYTSLRNSLKMETAEKLIYVKANMKEEEEEEDC